MQEGRGFQRAGRAAPRDFPGALPSGNPSEQPCQPSENPVIPYSFTHIYILFLIGFSIGPSKMHGQFRIGLPKIHRPFRNGPPEIHRRFRIGPPQKRSPLSTDFINLVKSDFEFIGVPFDEEKFSHMKQVQLKTFIHKNIYLAAL